MMGYVMSIKEYYRTMIYLLCLRLKSIAFYSRYYLGLRLKFTFINFQIISTFVVASVF